MTEDTILPTFEPPVEPDPVDQSPAPPPAASLIDPVLATETVIMQPPRRSALPILFYFDTPTMAEFGDLFNRLCAEMRRRGFTEEAFAGLRNGPDLVWYVHNTCQIFWSGPQGVAAEYVTCPAHHGAAELPAFLRHIEQCPGAHPPLDEPQAPVNLQEFAATMGTAPQAVPLPPGIPGGAALFQLLINGADDHGDEQRRVLKRSLMAAGLDDAARCSFFDPYNELSSGDTFRFTPGDEDDGVANDFSYGTYATIYQNNNVWRNYPVFRGAEQIPDFIRHITTRATIVPAYALAGGVPPAVQQAPPPAVVQTNGPCLFFFETSNRAETDAMVAALAPALVERGMRARDVQECARQMRDGYPTDGVWWIYADRSTGYSGASYSDANCGAGWQRFRGQQSIPAFLAWVEGIPGARRGTSIPNILAPDPEVARTAAIERSLGTAIMTLVRTAPSAPATRSHIRARLRRVVPADITTADGLMVWLRDNMPAVPVPPAGSRIVPSVTGATTGRVSARPPAGNGVTLNVTYTEEEVVRRRVREYRRGIDAFTLTTAQLTELAEDERRDGGDFGSLLDRVAAYLRDQVRDNLPETETTDEETIDTEYPNGADDSDIEFSSTTLRNGLRSFLDANPHLDPERDEDAEEDDEDEEDADDEAEALA